MSFSRIVIIVSHIPVLLTVVYAALHYRKLGPELKAFSRFIFLSGFIQFASLLLWFLQRNNMPLLHLYVAAGFACLAWFYRVVLSGFVSARLITGVIVLFLLFTGINSLFIQDIFTFNSNALVAESVLVIILALFTFIFLLNDVVKETGRHDGRSLAWINSGLFIYYSSALLIFYFGASLMRLFPTSLNLQAWVFHAFFSIIMYTCFLVGLWKRAT